VAWVLGRGKTQASNDLQISFMPTKRPPATTLSQPIHHSKILLDSDGENMARTFQGTLARRKARSLRKAVAVIALEPRAFA
jgi:hypothetical protein